MNESWNKDVRGTQVLPLINSDADIIRCVAGPGSGKTFGLVRRVERILHPEGLAVDGREVLVVAFNRVIARQLREDINARLKTFERKHDPVIRTIHALCVEVIGEQLRMLLPHEVDAMIYDVLQLYPTVAKLYEDFREAQQALRITRQATRIITSYGRARRNGWFAIRRTWLATSRACYWRISGEETFPSRAMHS